MSNLQFSIRNILILIAMAALFLALRRSYVLTHESGQIFRAHQLPPLMAALFILFCVFSLKWRGFRSLVLAGVGAAALIAVVLAVEIAEALRTIDYWEWSSDWPIFVQVVACHAAIGAAIGFVVAVGIQMLDKAAMRSKIDKSLRGPNRRI